MIKAADNSSKRNRIVLVEYVLLSEATVRDFPGKYIKVLVTGWNPIIFSTVEFKEDDAAKGGFVVQDLNINISGSDLNLEDALRNLSGKELLIKLTYDGGEIRVMGTEQNPVILSHSSEGSPVLQKLYCSRNSAEKAKILLS